MKKIRIIMSFIVLLGIFCFDHVHVHVIEAAGYGKCPNCESDLVFSSWSVEPTCTSGGIAFAVCPNGDGDGFAEVGPLGHDYEAEAVSPATCTEGGVTRYTCSRCGDSYDSYPEALGHNYVSKVTKAATCEEEGIRTYTCSRCNDSYTKKIDPLGHKYPEEWTVEKEAGFFSEGVETKTCEVCEEKMEQAIPKKSPTPLILSGSALAIAAGLLTYFGRFGKKAEKIVEEAKDDFKPSFEDKSVLVSTAYEELVDALKLRSFLEVTSCEFKEVEDLAKENEPDLVIIDVLSEDKLDQVIELKEKEEGVESKVAIVITDELAESCQEKLDELIEKETILNYVFYGQDVNDIIVKVILPILKPELSSDETLENIGSIADLLGIPAVSTILNAYVSGRDVKATLESEEIGVSETATIIADIASVLGMDTVGSVAGLVDDVDMVKGAFDKENGVYEYKQGIDGAKDIADVISDLLDQ